MIEQGDKSTHDDVIREATDEDKEWMREVLRKEKLAALRRLAETN